MSLSPQDIQAKLNHYVGQLSNYPQLNKIESQLGVPKAYVVPGLSLLLFFFVFFNIGAAFISNLIGFGIPAYYAFLAIESPGHDDDIQWLTYFVVFSFFTFAESLVNIVTYFPFYYLFKVGFIGWLMLPQTKGAKTLYLNVLRPIVFSKNKTSPRGSTFKADDLRAKASAATE